MQVSSVVVCFAEAEKPRDRAVISKWVVVGFPNASTNVHGSAVAVLAAGTDGQMTDAIALVVDHCVWAVARTESGDEVIYHSHPLNHPHHCHPFQVNIGGNIHDHGNSVTIATRCIAAVAESITSQTEKTPLMLAVMHKLRVDSDDAFMSWLEHGLSTDTASDITNVCFEADEEGDLVSEATSWVDI